jgi:RHS repeat-associated protein
MLLKININHYPFGSPMPSRSFSASSYRYGFNGKEKDDEINVDGGEYDFGARMYDSRLGRWWAIDPYDFKYPTLSPYCFVANSPLLFIDPDGKKITIPLSTRIFHREVYRAYMIFLKSNEGKEVYRDVASAKDARKLWNDKSGDGALSKTTNVILKAGKFKDAEGGLFAHGQTENEAKVNGEKKDIEFLNENDIKTISAPLKTTITIFLPPERPFLDNVEGAAHESAVHAHGILKFLKTIYDGVRGEDLVKAHKEGELDGDKNHINFSKGLNNVFEKFIKKFTETLKKESDKKEIQNYKDVDKKNNKDG